MANKNIKGITVQIGGDTTGLDKALSDVNKQANSLNAEMKQVDNALKNIDPDSTELLAQKQDILSKQIEVTADKLEKLKSVQDQVNKQVKDGKISETTYRGFQREVISTEAALKKLEQQQKELTSKTLSQSNAQEKLSEETIVFAEATENVVKAIESIPKNAYEQVQDSLKSSSDLSKSLEDEMKKVNKALDDVNPKNPELLAQKQEILNEQVNITTKRLGELREAQSRIESQVESGDIGEQQYREFQRELISTEKELANLSQQQIELEKVSNGTADEIQDLGEETEDAGEAAEESSSKFEGLSSTLKVISAAIGTAVLAVGAATVKLSKEFVQLGDSFNSAVNDIGVKTGATGEELEELGDIAQNVYTHNFGDSLEDVAEGLSLVKQNTGLIGDELQFATEASYKLRDGFDFDMGESSRAASALMKNMGISAEEAYNLIAYGAQNGANKNGDLLDTINEYSAQYASLGLSADQFINTLVDGAENGAFSVDKVGDAVKELNIRVKDGTANKAFAELGLVSKDNSENIEETTSKIADLEQKLKYAEMAQSQFNDKTSELTKTKNADSIKSYKEQISELKNSLNDMTSATDSTLPSTKELQAQFAAGGEQAQNAFNKVVAALDKIEDPVKKNQIAVELFGTQYEDLQETVLPALKNVSTNTEAVGDVLADINKIQYNDLNSALEGTSRSIQGVFMDTASEVSGGITDVLSRLGNAINEADGDFDKIGEAVGTALEGILSVISEQLPKVMTIVTSIIKSIGNAIVKNMPNLITTAVSIFDELFKSLMEALPELTQGFVLLISELLNSLISNLPTIVSSLLEVLTTLITELTAQLPTLMPMIIEAVLSIIQIIIDNLPTFLNALLQLAQGLQQGMLDAIPIIIEALPQFIQAIVDFLLESLPQMIEAYIQLLTALVDALPSIIKAIVEVLPQIITGIVNALIASIPEIVQAGIDLLTALIDALPEIIATIVDALPKIITGIVKALTDAIPKLIEAGIKLFVAIIQNLPEIIKGIVTHIPEIIKGIVEGFGSLVGEMAKIGGNIISGIWDGISGAASWLWEQVSGFCSGLWDNIKGFFGIHSPSTLMRDTVGNNIAYGVGEGFVNAMPEVIDDMTNALPETLDSDISTDFNIQDNLDEINEQAVVISFIPDLSFLDTIRKALENISFPVDFMGIDREGTKLSKLINLTLNIETFNNNSDRDLDSILDYVSEELANRSQRLGVVWGDT